MNMIRFLILSVFLTGTAFGAINPKYFRLMAIGDASTTMTFGFSTKRLPIMPIRVVIYDKKTSKKIKSYSPSKTKKFKALYHTFFSFEDLTPDTEYKIELTYSGNKKLDHLWFRTLPNGIDSKLSIIAGGDSRNSRTTRQNANLLVSKIRPHLVLFGGDMTGSASEKQWDRWLSDWQYTITKDGQLFPVSTARGNHEPSNQDIYSIFNTPKTAYYETFTKDLLKVFTLNTEVSRSRKSPQTLWLKDRLEKSQNYIWRFAQYHRPMRPHVKRKSEGQVQYKYWAPLFYEHKVQLVVESDSHTMKSTLPLKPSSKKGLQGFEIDNKNGSIYIGEGCWGAPLRTNDDKKAWTHSSGKFNGFHLIWLSKERMDIRTVKVDNAKSVKTRDLSNYFSLPAGIDLFTPKGEVQSMIKGDHSSFQLLEPSNQEVLQKGETLKINYRSSVEISKVELEFLSANKKVELDVKNPMYTFEKNGTYPVKIHFLDSKNKARSFESTIDVNSIKEYSLVSTKDDFEQRSSGRIYSTSSDLELVKDGRNIQKVAIRFRNVNLSDLRNIKSAKLKFHVDEKSTVSTSLKIYLKDLTNQGFTFRTRMLSKAISEDDQFVSWKPEKWYRRYSAKYSPNLKSLFESLPLSDVKRDLLFIIDGYGTRTAISQDKSAKYGPKLIIETN